MTSTAARTFRHLRRVVALLVCLLAPVRAHADDPARARQLFDGASTAREAGRWDEARRLLEQSLAASPRFATAWNLVTVLEHEGDLAGAERLLERIRAGAFGDLDAERSENVATRLAELSPRVATLDLTAPEAPGGAVRVGGQLVARLDAAGRARVRVSPGAPIVSVASTDARTAERTVTIGPGETLAVELAVGLRPLRTEVVRDDAGEADHHIAPGGAGRGAPPRSFWSTPLPWIVLGAVVVVGSAVTLGLTLDAGTADPVAADFQGEPL